MEEFEKKQLLALIKRWRWEYKKSFLGILHKNKTRLSVLGDIKSVVAAFFSNTELSTLGREAIRDNMNSIGELYLAEIRSGLKISDAELNDFLRETRNEIFIHNEPIVYLFNDLYFALSRQGHKISVDTDEIFYALFLNFISSKDTLTDQDTKISTFISFFGQLVKAEEKFAEEYLVNLLEWTIYLESPEDRISILRKIPDIYAARIEAGEKISFEKMKYVIGRILKDNKSDKLYYACMQFLERIYLKNLEHGFIVDQNELNKLFEFMDQIKNENTSNSLLIGLFAQALINRIVNGTDVTDEEINGYLDKLGINWSDIRFYKDSIIKCIEQLRIALGQKPGQFNETFLWKLATDLDNIPVNDWALGVIKAAYLARINKENASPVNTEGILDIVTGKILGKDYRDNSKVTLAKEIVKSVLSAQVEKGRISFEQALQYLFAAAAKGGKNAQMRIFDPVQDLVLGRINKGIKITALEMSVINKGLSAQFLNLKENFRTKEALKSLSMIYSARLNSKDEISGEEIKVLLEGMKSWVSADRKSFLGILETIYAEKEIVSDSELIDFIEGFTAMALSQGSRGVTVSSFRERILEDLYEIISRKANKQKVVGPQVMVTLFENMQSWYEEGSKKFWQSIEEIYRQRLENSEQIEMEEIKALQDAIKRDRRFIPEDMMFNIPLNIYLAKAEKGAKVSFDEIKSLLDFLAEFMADTNYRSPNSLHRSFLENLGKIYEARIKNGDFPSDEEISYLKEQAGKWINGTQEKTAKLFENIYL
ncbi:MAG: hypothetical protein HQL27_10045, partial [Candidatus Omnitrophica bacterium]|nr:hypothetical protein [Candidatus Omnitrophota bacterium]